MSDMIDFGIQEGEDLSVPIITAGERLLCAEEALLGESSAKKPMVTVTFSCPDEPGALDLKHYFSFPDPAIKEAANKLRKAEWAAFCSTFGLALKFNPDEVRMSKPRGFVLVRHEKYQGREQAKIEKFLVPVPQSA